MSLGGLTGGGNISGIEGDLSNIANAAEGFANQAAAQAPGFAAQGTQLYGPSADQFVAGAAGQVTPDQQKAIDQTLQQMNLGTQGTYANLGLGGSTMETQDINANKQKSLAQTAGFSSLDETLGLSGLQEAAQYYGLDLSSLTGAGQILGGATQALSGAGTIAQNQQATTLGLLGSLGSAVGGSNGIFGSGGLAGLFGGGAGASGLSTAAALGTGALF